MDEQTLARYCSQHDRMAEYELYNRYAVRVFAICRRYLRREDQAEDLMLEVLVQALDKMDSFRYVGKGSLEAWISRIAINMAVDQIKRERRWLTISTIPLDVGVIDTIPDMTEQEMEMVPTEKLQEWISGLPAMRRVVFNLHCIDGYSHKEIGAMLGISETGSSSVLAKARKTLKEMIMAYLKERDK